MVESSTTETSESRQERRKKKRQRRWADAATVPAPADGGAAAATSPSNGDGASASAETTATTKPRARKSRFSSAPPTQPAPPPTTTGVGPPGGGGLDASKQARAAALQQSIAAKLAALKSGVGGTKRPAAPAIAGRASLAAPLQPPPAKRAKTYDLDLSVTKPTFEKGGDGASSQEKVNPYLSTASSPAAKASTSSIVTTDEGVVDPAGGKDNFLLDSRLAGGRTGRSRRHNKPLSFVEPGTYVKIAERKREKAANASKSGFASGRKAGTYVHGMGMVSENAIDIRGEGMIGATAGAGYGDDDYDEGKPLPPRFEDDVHATCPLAIEWWDAELLPPKLRKDLSSKEKKAMATQTRKQMEIMATSAILSSKGVGEVGKDKVDVDVDATGVGEASSSAATTTEKTAEEREYEQSLRLVDKCFKAASIENSKTHTLVQHPIPLRPPGSVDGDPNAADPSSQKPKAVLHLTKKEMKRQRKLRRAEKQRELQDKQAAGLIPPPEPRLTLSNFMKVLGDQAVMDPSKMEKVVLEQIQARKIKHEKMNEERKLTPDERREKRTRKLQEDTSTSVSVALFVVKDMTHRYHRTKVDLNAQQNSITGGVLECVNSPKLALVIAEGGPKAIKRFTRLMTVRMKWKGENFRIGEEEDDEDDGGMGEGDDEGVDGSSTQKFNPNNTCELVWTGMGVKRMFNSFQFQECSTSEIARKVLEAKGVAHFWDQVLAHVKNSGDDMVHFRLGGSDSKVLPSAGHRGDDSEMAD